MTLKKSAFVFIFSVFSLYAFSHVGLGASYSAEFDFSPSSLISFTAKTDESPWTVFLNAHLKTNTVTFFADDWFINERSAEHVDYFVLWGISGGFRFDEDVYEIGTGCRFGAGLDFFFFSRHFEIFAQAVWNPYFAVKKESGSYSPVFKIANFPLSIGTRFWF